ncbi:outer membrane protein W [Oceanisphaera marina]|uniref:Outer membrane protein W n=1 Tax=Oceanisphaera marina TaxID=2017550 RepID=A0ABQ1IJ62_9GAMM|nr:OmpW family outer membrane protein [Oceanisphaera marina]GGB40585.1 outer membrane protein W [Oceanisphaera marina]
MKKVSLLVAAALLAPSAFAHQAGDFLVRGGAITVSPTGSGGDISGVGHLDVQNDTQLGLTFSYMLTDNWGVELLAATPFSHGVNLDGNEVAKVKHLPPSLMAQYYFGNAQSKVRPYVGAGINYTFFFDEEGRNGLKDTKVNADDSWGLAAQAGIDMAVTDNLFVNGSVWYMDIDTDVTVDTGTDVLKAKTSIDPIGLMVGLGYRF